MTTIAELQTRCHEASYAAGWWHNPGTGLPYIPGDNLASGELWTFCTNSERAMITHYWPMLIACKIALINSEVSEGLEAFRRGAMDDKLSHRLGLETEMADSLIRQFDLAGAMMRAQRLGVVEQHGVTFNLEGSVTEKMAFNVTRPDHQVAARRAVGGKCF